MLKFIEDKFKVDIKGVVYELSYPALDQIEQLEGAAKDGVFSFGELISFLEKMGLPSAVSRSLPVKFLQQIYKGLAGAEKN